MKEVTMPEQTRKALVVDDDPEVRALVTAILELENWLVVEAVNGEEACVFAARENPDLIVLDVMMPVKSGFEAFKELREDQRTCLIPILLISAINDFELGANHTVESVGQTLGVPYPEGFIEKPLDRTSFLAAIDRVLAN